LLAKKLFFILLSTFALLFQNNAFFLLESLKSLSRGEPSAPPPAAAASAETSEALGGYTIVKWKILTPVLGYSDDDVFK
jgi:hypothetical protein